MPDEKERRSPRDLRSSTRRPCSTRASSAASRSSPSRPQAGGFGELLEILEVEGFAEHRRDLEQARGAPFERLEPPLLGLLQGGRQDVGGRQDLVREGEEAVFVAHDAARIGQGLEQLEAEERVAFGRLVQLLHQVGGQRAAAQEGFGEPPHVGRAERMERDQGEPRVAGETFEEAAHRVAARRFRGPVGADEKQRRRAQPAQQVGKTSSEASLACRFSSRKTSGRPPARRAKVRASSSKT